MKSNRLNQEFADMFTGVLLISPVISLNSISLLSYYKKRHPILLGTVTGLLTVFPFSYVYAKRLESLPGPEPENVSRGLVSTLDRAIEIGVAKGCKEAYLQLAQYLYVSSILAHSSMTACFYWMAGLNPARSAVSAATAFYSLAGITLMSAKKENKVSKPISSPAR